MFKLHCKRCLSMQILLCLVHGNKIMYTLCTKLSYAQHHRLRGSASPVLTATGFVNGKWQFWSPQRIDTPHPIKKKFVTGDYVGDPYGCAILGAYPSTWGFWAHGWNITKIIWPKLFLFMPFFGNWLTSAVSRPVLRIMTFTCVNTSDCVKSTIICSSGAAPALVDGCNSPLLNWSGASFTFFCRGGSGGWSRAECSGCRAIQSDCALAT